MICKLLSFDANKTYDGIGSISLPGISGRMQILPGHAEFFALLNPGKIVMKSSKQSKATLEINGGGCYFKDETLVICLDQNKSI